ncbi:hypothetical protein SAMN04487904_104310 [Actinopolyspora lacussalsi subsp. righensis]|uniref:Transposase IS4-like domain-containing protein n=1 Tax=Actinopolyspora righensis TaxID=995060 RepID=A0A1I6ZG00_9ACTN|nr:transposase [Actinopolyspora righensis]SFT61535.1 hypothetical protein SAMN04487904_104310 [Actinopolyspora righensis]
MRSRRGSRRSKPAKLHADKGYDDDTLRTWLRQRNIVPRIARTGIEPRHTLGRHRWVIERSLAWLAGLGISTGHGYLAPSWIGAALAGMALLTALVGVATDRRERRTTRVHAANGEPAPIP